MSETRLAEFTALILRQLAEHPNTRMGSLLAELSTDHPELDANELRVLLWHLASRGQIEFDADWRIERGTEPAAA